MGGKHYTTSSLIPSVTWHSRERCVSTLLGEVLLDLSGTSYSLNLHSYRVAESIRLWVVKERRSMTVVSGNNGGTHVSALILPF